MRQAVIFFGGVLAVGVLCGCDESPRVERRTVSEATPPESKSALETAQTEAPHGMSPHGMASPAAGRVIDDPLVSLPAAELTAPKEWVRKEPGSSFVLAEFSLPHAEGDENDGRLTVSIAGGTISSNIDRWRGQFADKKSDSERTVEAGGVKISVVDITGLFHESRGMMGPSTDRPNYRMLGAIFDVDGQMHFIKAYGPVKTMAKWEGGFDAFLKSLKKKG